MVLWNTYILIGKADPERETIRLGNELYMRIVLDVVDTGHVSPTLTTLFQGLVPIQLLRQNLVGQATVTLQIQRWRVVLFFQFLGGRERKHVRKMSCSRETERERKKKKNTVQQPLSSLQVTMVLCLNSEKRYLFDTRSQLPSVVSPAMNEAFILGRPLAQLEYWTFVPSNHFIWSSNSNMQFVLLGSLIIISRHVA